MKRKFIKTFESFTAKKLTKINEGGGSGVEFTAECSVNYDYSLSNSGLELIKKDISTPETFTAKGYMHFAENVDTDGMFNLVEGAGVTEEELKAVLIDRIRYCCGDDKILDCFPEWDKETMKEMTVGEYLSIHTEDVIDVTLQAHFDFKDMHFGGWIRGGFSKDDVVLSYDPNEKYGSDINGEYSNVWFGKCEYITDNWTDLLEKVAPKFTATEQFCDWFEYDFYAEEEEEELDEAAKTLTAKNIYTDFFDKFKMSGYISELDGNKKGDVTFEFDFDKQDDADAAFEFLNQYKSMLTILKNKLNKKRGFIVFKDDKLNEGHEFWTKYVVVDKERAKEFEEKLKEKGFKWDEYDEKERFDKIHFGFTKPDFEKIGDLVEEFSDEVFDEN